MIKLSNVYKQYQDVNAVNGISLDIPDGVIYGIIGKSGAGKSTLVRLMGLLEKVESGEIWYNDDRVDNLVGDALLKRRQTIGMIFQNFNLFSSRNVYKNIAYPMEIIGKSKGEIASRVEELLGLVGLSDKVNSPISQLSGGQKQRVAIARALANNPKILFCDEATSALDPQTTLSILNLIKDIKKSIDLTVVMITHQMEVVKEVCDYVSVLDNGAVVESGTLQEIFSFPKTKIAREFISGIQPLPASNGNSYEKWKGVALYRLHFSEDTANNPIISQLIRNYNVEINIISGDIKTVKNTPFGELVVEFIGSDADVKVAKDWLASQDVLVEELANG